MDTGANYSRLTSMIYPDGFTIGYNYASGIDSAISRLTSMTNSSTTLESLSYLGLGTVVKRAHSQSGADLIYTFSGIGAGEAASTVDFVAGSVIGNVLIVETNDDTPPVLRFAIDMPAA